ncbi:MAG: SAM-dependent DNA methyltransferase, partial [Anaerolineales bacterium]|nr:SAM-dependent DNA methyltransferase [Anaerolineales bacterium]
MPDSTHITSSGGLISAAFIESIREPGSRQRGIEPASFALPWAQAPKHAAALEETIATAWELLLERWDAVHSDLPMMDAPQVRTRWLLPVFELLDFRPAYLRGDTLLDAEGKLRFPLTYRGWEGDGAPVIHTVIPSQDLDDRTAGRGVKGKSPHDMLQAFLNASPGDHWAILSNGILLRLLRDYHHTFTKGYVQFDLEAIFETRNYGDFRALYRMAHASRFTSAIPPDGEVETDDEGPAPLELFYQDSVATGVKVGEDLRGQVRQAIETLANGFLSGRGELIGALQEDGALCQRFYGEILHVVYRVLFLLFAEQRGMLPGRDSLYAESYAVARLRARAEGDLPREDDFTDLWEGLQVTFRMVREGVPELGVFGYDGMLFDDDQTPLLSGPPSSVQGPGVRGGICNSDLLRAVRALTLIEREGVLQRISYADLGVEELGSIYESLLDYTPRVTRHPEEVDGREIAAAAFVLDPRGSERKTTGSYYTHPSLVNELIKSALLPVARERLAAAGLPVIAADAIGEATAGLLSDYAGLSAEQRAAGEAAILALRVCDPAAGSGHFLVKANNVLGAELARIRSGDEYPSEAAVQAAKRDALAHCIYAVDLNPMAVELCKVSLWINASVPDAPLNFLDHHIRCGNSLVGAPRALMAQGVPDEAFEGKIAGNDRAVASALRRRNREERRALEAGGGYQPALFRVRVYEPDGAVWEHYQAVGRLAEDAPQAARQQYAAYLATNDYRRAKLEADCWTAAFFWPLTKGMEWAPTAGEFRRLRDDGPQALPAGALEQIEALAARHRFFHWGLEFRDVFGPSAGGAGGFDVVLGN